MKKTEHYGFDGQYKIHQCCSKRKDEINLRPFVGYCIFMDGYVYATDAHMMVRASMTKISNLSQEDIDKLQNKAIRGDLFRKMLSYDIKAITDTAIECIREQDETVLFGLVKVLRKYVNTSINPPCKNEIYTPELDEFFAKYYNTKGYPCDKIGVSVDYVGRIASAMGAQKVGLFFNERKDKGIISLKKLADDFNAVLGLLMPCEIN